VTISKDGQFATLTFNQQLISQPLPANKSAPGVIQPPPLPQPGFQKPGLNPGAAPTPHVRGTIQRNPQPQSPQQPLVPPPAADQ
jgi:hypothetical protein